MKKNIFKIGILVSLLIVLIIIVISYRTINESKKNSSMENDSILEYTIIDNSGKKGVIDKNSNTIIPCQYKSIDSVSDDIFLVQNMEEKYGYINTKGETIVSFQYDEGHSYHNGVGVLTNERGSTYFDTNGEIIGLPNCALEGKINTYNRDDYLAMQDPETKLYGFVNIQGEFKTKFKWQYANNFCNNLALVGDKTGEYVIDMEENIIIPSSTIKRYSYIEPVFEKELLIVYKKDKACGVLNKKGKEIIPCSLENTHIEIVDNSIVVNKGEEQYNYDFEGNDVSS